MTSGFTNPPAATSCRLVHGPLDSRGPWLVVSAVHHSSVGLAEWWADLQNLHPRIFLNYNPCANLLTLDISYNVCSQFTARLQVTVSVWQRWVERCGVSGQVICLSGFYATTVVGGRRDSWVRKYDWERQRGSKQGSYIQADCAVPGLTAEARRLTAIAIMWWSSDHGGSYASSLPCCCQSRSMADAFFAQRRAGLQPCKFSCSAGYILPKLGYLFH